MDFKGLFVSVYQRVALIGTTQFCLLFCGIALIIAAMLMPKQPYQRFVPYSDSVNTALDTKTGQICFTHPVKLAETNQSRQELIAQGQILPLCYDLYKERK